MGEFEKTKTRTPHFTCYYYIFKLTLRLVTSIKVSIIKDVVSVKDTERTLHYDKSDFILIVKRIELNPCSIKVSIVMGVVQEK